MAPTIALLVIATIATIVLSSFMTPGDRQVGAFARVYSFGLTERNAPLVRQSIARMRRWRLGGAVIGLALGLLLAIITGEALSGAGVVHSIAIGFAGGIIAAELTRRPMSAGASVASASPRRVQQYIAPWILITLTGVGLVVAAYLVHAAVARTALPGPADGIARTRWSSVALGTVWWSALSLGTVISLRRLSQAPEPAATPDVFEAHRAVRSSAMVTVLGAYWMGMSTLGSRVIWPVVITDSGWMSWPTGVAGFLMSIGAVGGVLVCCNALPRTGGYLRVPRIPQQAAA